MQIEIPKDLEKLLLDVSKKLSQEPSSLVLGALQSYLEDQYDYHVGINAYNDYIQNGRKSTSLEDVKKELGL
jgi:RHH-type rel operon transcriptional repressor/antitoxin RelB